MIFKVQMLQKGIKEKKSFPSCVFFLIPVEMALFKIPLNSLPS